MTDLLWQLQQLGWIDVLDILLVASIFFWLLYLVRGTQAVALLRGVLLLIVVIALLSNVIQLRAFGWLVRSASPALLAAIPIVFQQELRHALERIGRAGSLFKLNRVAESELERTLKAVIEASRTLAGRRHGALIVLERETGLQEFVDSGVVLEAQVTPELLTTVFDPHTTLHDGAVIVRDGELVAAACVLPLSTAFLADRQLGLRHRAAIGVTEESDAIVVVVSEERGTISVTHNGRIIRNLDAGRLDSVLHALFQPVLERGWPRWIARLRQTFGNEERGE